MLFPSDFNGFHLVQKSIHNKSIPRVPTLHIWIPRVLPTKKLPRTSSVQNYVHIIIQEIPFLDSL